MKLLGVSVIVPTYNREKYLKECLDSALAQEYDGPLEIIVSDDGSTDKTVEIAESYGSPVTVVRKPEGCTDQGPAPTRNRGIAASRYPLIAFLDSDDLFLPGHLGRLANVLTDQMEIGLTFDQAYGMNAHGKERWEWQYSIMNETRMHESVFLDPFIPMCAIMIRKNVIENIGGPFDETLLLAEDTDFWLRILESFPCRFIQGYGSIVREHDARSVRNIRKSYECSQKVLEKAIKRFPYPKSLIRKRKAVIQFRLAQGDLLEQKYFSAVKRLLCAFFLDPIRAIQTVLLQKIV